MKPFSPTQPYCLASSKSLTPSFSLAFSKETRLRQSHQPAAVGFSEAGGSFRTCCRTVPKIPSAPISASTCTTGPSSNSRANVPPSLSLPIETILLPGCRSEAGNSARSSLSRAARWTTRPGSVPARSKTGLPACGPDPYIASMSIPGPGAV